MYSSTLPHFVRLFNHKIPNTTIHSNLFTKNNRFYGKYRGYGRKFSIWFGEQSLLVAKVCARQFEFIAAQRLRRSFQFFQLYTRIWDEIALKRFMKSWRRRLARNTKEFLMAAAGVTMFNWDEERIPDEELYSYAKEIEQIHQLRFATVVCKNCNLRLIIDHQQPNVQYCVCHSSKPNIAPVNDDGDWQPFIERQDMLIWRKEEESTGLYAYKVFGTFSDVSAEEFLKVQVDIDYRKVWDPTAKELEVIDNDSSCTNGDDCQNEVVYWEMIWPRLFSNRDYVYKRRWIVDKENGIVVIANRSTDHPDAPNRPDTCRVTTYWSYTVIKSCESFSKPGIQFVLTYFEDPGINIPSAITSWVAMSGLPDFLCRMRQAAKDYKNYISIQSESDDNIKLSNLNEEENDSTMKSITDEQEKTEDETQIVIVHDSTNDSNANGSVTVEVSIENSDNNTDDHKDCVSDKDVVSEQTVQEQNGFLRYFFLTKLFA